MTPVHFKLILVVKLQEQLYLN